MIWGFVGGRDFDATALTALLKSVPPTDIVATGSAVGSEKFVREQAPELGLDLRVAPLRHELFDHDPKASAAPCPWVFPPDDTRMKQLIRLDQAMLYGERMRAMREGVKFSGAMEAQVTDIVFAARGGTLVLMGGGRAKQAQAIVKRVQETPFYNNPRQKAQMRPRWEVVAL